MIPRAMLYSGLSRSAGKDPFADDGRGNMPSERQQNRS